MKKCSFCGEEISNSTAVCQWCGRRQQKQSDFHDLAEAIKKVDDLLSDVPPYQEAVFVYLNQHEFEQWDAKDEKTRETFRESIRESSQSDATIDNNPVVILTRGTDRFILSVCKVDQEGIWHFIDLEGLARKIPCGAPPL